MLEVALELWVPATNRRKDMSDAIRIEQRLHDLEQRLHDAFASWRRPGRDHADRLSARDMEQQAVERLFADRRRSRAPGYAHDVRSAREMEQEAIKRLYGGRSTIVVQDEHERGDEGS
jgi:hypothetical protein